MDLYLAKQILSAGQKADQIGFSDDDTAWLCSSFLAQAALMLGDLELAKTYAERGPEGLNALPLPPGKEFKEAIFGLIALRKGDKVKAREHLCFNRNTRFVNIVVQLAHELIKEGEEAYVVKHLEAYLRTKVSAFDAALWLEDIMNSGLVP
jgi:hypothetical protein